MCERSPRRSAAMTLAQPARLRTYLEDRCFLVKPILSDDSTDLLPISGRVVIFSFWQSEGRSCCWLLVAHRLQERGRSYLIQQGPGKLDTALLLGFDNSHVLREPESMSWRPG
jgi:hypothetical protein